MRSTLALTIWSLCLLALGISIGRSSAVAAGSPAVLEVDVNPGGDAKGTGRLRV